MKIVSPPKPYEWAVSFPYIYRSFVCQLYRYWRNLVWTNLSLDCISCFVIFKFLTLAVQICFLCCGTWELWDGGIAVAILTKSIISRLWQNRAVLLRRQLSQTISVQFKISDTFYFRIIIYNRISEMFRQVDSWFFCHYSRTSINFL